MPPNIRPGGGRRDPVTDTRKPHNTKNTIKRLLTYIGKYKGRLVFAFICVILSTASNLGASYMLKPIVDNLVKTDISAAERIASLASSLALMAAVYLVGVAANYLQQRTMIHISQNSLYAIRSDLFTKMQRLPIRFFDTNSTGEVMSRYTNDVDAIGEILNTTAIQIFSGILTLIGTLAIMLYTNAALTCVTVIMTPLMALVGGTISKKSSKFFRKQQSDLGSVNGYVEETVTGQNVVKVFCHEEKVVSEFSELNEELRKSQVRAQFVGGIMGPCMNAMNQVNYTLTAMAGSLFCLATGMFNLSVGGLTVFVNYSRQFSRPINELSQQATVIMSALAGAERVFEVMDAPNEYDGNEGDIVLDKVVGNVAVENITFGYNPDKVILKDVSFYAHPGQKIALVGSTGAGKTTIMNLITRFYDVDKGRITVDGIPIRDIKKDSLRGNIAMVLQDTHLFSGTVMENIRYGRLDATDEEVIAAAKTASAHSFIKHLPQGYNTVLNGDGANLSQGQRQLLNIARAALSKAQILILDEATSSVDTRTEQQINKGMDALMENRTTFVIAHRLSTIRNSDAIMVLEHGEIIERGTHSELLALKGRYYELYMGIKELD
ncbi:MAG: ABC transporter ATP-binding protein/permease [Firmicutes bacterium]|nr:ABC transporter ATP-binding protein/permease [Bacillota bacterium]